MAARPPSAEDFAELEVEHEHQSWGSGSNGEGQRSSCEESEWHLIDQSDCGSRPRSEHEHVELEQEASAAAVEELASEGSSESITSTGENEQVADSFLQMSFQAERAQSDAGTAEAGGHPAAAPHESEARLVRRMSGLSSEGGLEGFSELAEQAAAAAAAAEQAPVAQASEPARQQAAEGEAEDRPAGLVASVKGSVLELVSALYQHVAHMLYAVKGGMVEQYECISQVVLDSLDMAYKSAHSARRAVHEAVPAAVEAAVTKLRAAHPKRLSGSQWAALALSVSQLATAAVLVATLVRSARLQRALASKDRELGGLLMRIFSLQELVQQGGSRAVPLIRHTSHMYIAP